MPAMVPVHWVGNACCVELTSFNTAAHRPAMALKIYTRRAFESGNGAMYVATVVPSCDTTKRNNGWRPSPLS